jgi:predicted aconitase
MKLTKEEQSWLDGVRGPGAQRSMQHIVETGEAFDAEKLIPVTAAHICLFEGQVGSKAAEALFSLPEPFLEGVESFAVPTTLNSLVLDLSRPEKMNFSSDTVKCVNKTMPAAIERYTSRGGIPTFTCTPQTIIPLTYGQHVAVTEGGVVEYVNSVIGARTHYETMTSAIPAAVVGKVPLYGMHLRKNRYGQVLVKIGDDLDPERFTYADYGAMAFYAAGIAEDRIPVWTGIPVMSEADLKYFTIAHCISGAMAMEHVVGVTPEAPTLEEAFGPNKPKETIVVDKKALDSTYEYLSSAKKNEIEAVVLGCPHLDIQELKEIAQLLSGKKVHSGVRVWCGTNEHTWQLAKKMGLVDAIEKSGAFVTKNSCSGTCNFASLVDFLGVHTLATNAVTCAALVTSSSGGQVLSHYRNMKDCVDIAVKGRIS